MAIKGTGLGQTASIALTCPGVNFGAVTLGTTSAGPDPAASRPPSEPQGRADGAALTRAASRRRASAGSASPIRA